MIVGLEITWIYTGGTVDTILDQRQPASCLVRWIARIGGSR